MTFKNILVIDDDEQLTSLLSEYFTSQNYDVSVCHDGASGLKSATMRTDIDVILLDVMMPEMDGFEVLKQLRQTHMTPVIMLTAKGDDYDRVLGLELGADDYLPKPFNHRELSARIKALLRRSEFVASHSSEQPLEIGPIKLNSADQSVTANGKPVELTSTEFMLLKLLMLSVGDLVTKASISEQVLGRRLAAFDRSIDMHVSNIRKKFAEFEVEDVIKTVRGSGYIMRKVG
jgi:two-component system response regulator CpxR